MTRIMEGIRVLEVAAWTYVPMAGGVLAEWGADVLKIEHPESGDPQRGLISSGLLPAGAAVNFVIEHPNRGKRSVAIDLSSDDGHELLPKLAAMSDVFLTNFLPGARKRLRIDVEDIRAANPNIIYARGSGNGPRGPEAGRGGYDNSTYWARGGSADAAFLQSAGPYPPSQPSGAYGDTIGGLAIAGGIAAALFHRQRTGEALTIDSSLLGMGAWAMGFAIAGCAAFGLERFPIPRREESGNPIVGMYRTSDDRYLALVMLQSDRYWPDLMEKVGRPDLVTDSRFADSAARAQNSTECIRVLDEIFASRSFEEWKKVLADVEGVWAPVQSPSEVVTDPQVVANDYVREVKAEDGSTFKLVASPLEFNETPSEIRRAPKLGEHTDEVLVEMGLDMDQVIDLKVKGAIL